MSNENVEHNPVEAVPSALNPVLPETTELSRLLLAQDLRVGMTLKEYEAPRG